MTDGPSPGRETGSELGAGSSVGVGPWSRADVSTTLPATLRIQTILDKITFRWIGFIFIVSLYSLPSPCCLVCRVVETTL